MMKILSYALKNSDFIKVFSTKDYSIDATNKPPLKREYQNTNRLMLTKNDSYLSRYYEYCVGGKTGYTDEAGRCLLTYGKKDNKNLILGVFGATSSGIEDVRYADSINLFEYGFNNFEKQKVLDKKDYFFSYRDNNSNTIYHYCIENDIFALVDQKKKIL